MSSPGVLAVCFLLRSNAKRVDGGFQATIELHQASLQQAMYF